MTITERIFALSNRLIQTTKEVIGQCTLQVTEHGLLEPRFLAYLLLCRTYTNFSAAVLLVQRRLVVEARTLTRCCFENAFSVAGLREQGRAFADRMKEDDEAGRKVRLQFARSSASIFDSLELEMQQAVDAALSGIERPAFLSPKSAASIGAFKELYLAYSQFSGDAAHPTLTALNRYWQRDENNEIEVVAGPESKQEELDQTLLFACMAVLGILGAVDEMFGRVPAGRALPAISDEIRSIQDAEAALTDTAPAPPQAQASPTGN
jgi:hypothetical protein